MLLLVGLGNPGARFQNHRHNVGFMAIDLIQDRWRFNSPRARFKSEAADGNIDGVRVLALKPQTHMNNSGEAVGEAMRFYKLTPDDIFVIHDELDLAPAKVRVKKGGGVAGHNGLRSLAAHIGPDFWRVRIGIGHPGEKSRVTGHVLGNFAKEDAAWVDPLLKALAEAAPQLVRFDAAGVMNKVALALQPPRKKESSPAPKESPSDEPAKD